MEKVISFLIGILLMGSVSIAGVPYIDKNDVTDWTYSQECIEAIGEGQTIATSDTKTINCYNIAGFSTFAIHNLTASSGIPTFLFESVDQRGNVVSTAAMTENVDITNIDGINCNIKIINGVAAPITVTYSILIAD